MLERDYDIAMSIKEIRVLTFAKLDQLTSSTPQSAGDTATPASEAVSQELSVSVNPKLKTDLKIC